MKQKLLYTCFAVCLVLSAFIVTKPSAAAKLDLTPKYEAATCESLMDLKIPGVTITAAESITRSVEERPGLVIYGPEWKSPKSAFGQASVPPPFCRVAGTAAPDINFEVWLPPAEKWNGKFNGVGNGALAGGINYPAMVKPLGGGYAVGSTDGGHQSKAPVEGDWMQGRPDHWYEFGFTSVHQMTRASKAIVAAYYGDAPKYAYFTGCSGGGQQGLAEVQRYPADYDGVVSGAPANFPTRMWPGETYPSWVTHRSKAYAIPVEKLAMINKAAVAACDKLDGTEDGLIGDPRECKFDPATLICTGADSPECLTKEQADSVALVYAGLKDPTTGEQFWPGYEPGSELGWPGHIGEPFIIPQGYFKAMVFNNPKWDWKTFDFSDPKDFATLYDADARYGPILNANDADLTAFNALGGKLILWHGWADQNIAPRNTINYYNNVVEMAGSLEAAQEYARLYLIPGVGHCSGGAGTDTFNMLVELENWVEKGTPPGAIPATHSTKGKVDLSRPLCPFPQVAKYDGSGSVAETENFTCEAIQ